ncbi:MAG: hypothetical protein II237_01640, partial [Clostridia bacterium]|nr:hypothetical protein [Clostridia bacterium]
MKTTKKALSVLLAVIMIMSSMSVCFGTFGPVITASAADNTTAVNNFVSAVDEYAKKVGKFTEFGYSYDNKNYVKTWTYNATYWSEFNIVCNVIDKLHAAVMGLDEYTISATHNDNKLCGDGYNSSTQQNKCTDWGYVKDALIKAMGTNYKTLQSTASIDYLLDAVLNYKEVPTASGDDPGVARPANGKDHDAGSFEKSSSLPAQLWNDVIINAPSNAKDQIIAAAATIAEIPAGYTTQYYYRLGLQRCNQYKSSDCQTKDGTKYHMAIQDQSGKAQTVAPKSNATATIDKSTLEAAQTAFSNTYKSYFATTDKNGVLALNSDETSLNKILSDIKDKKAKAEAAFGTEVYNKYLGGYPYARTVKNIEEALIFLGFQKIIDTINGLMDVDYSSYNSTQLAGHLAALEEAYASYKGLSDADKADILATYDFNPAEVDAKIAEINAAYTRLLVEEKLDAINEHLNAYENKWTIEDVDNDNDAERLNYNTAWAACLIVEQDYNTLKTLDKAVIAEVAGADFFGRVEALYNHLVFLSTAANYNDAYTPKYREFFSSVQPNVPSQDTADLLAALKYYDNWYAELRNLIDGMASGLSPEVAEILFDGVKDDMLSYMDHAYAVLNARVETQINLAYDLYTAHKDIYGPTVHYVSLESYLIVTDSIGKIDTPAYEFMKSTPN